MRASLRLIFCLVVAVTLVSILFALYEVRIENGRQRHELERRAQLLAESLQETVEPLLDNSPLENLQNLQRIVERFGNRERLAGVVIYDADGQPILMTANLATRLGRQTPTLNKAVYQDQDWNAFVKVGQDQFHIYGVPLHRNHRVVGALAVLHDAAYIEATNLEMWRNTAAHLLVQMLLITGFTLLIVRWSMNRPIARMAQWLRDQRSGTATAHTLDLPV